MLLGASMTLAAIAGVKKVAHPEVKVTIYHVYERDAAFEKMRSAFADAVRRKDEASLLKLVAPTFLWTVDGRPADGLDLGRGAVENFKVVFGFRTPGNNEDGGVENGPFWDVLAAFADPLTYYTASDTGNLVCGPLAADVVDEQAYEQARKKVETGAEGAEWYFTRGDTAVAKTPGDAGPPLAKVGAIAMPLISTYPVAKAGEPAPQITHVEVLLPSGRSGWIPLASVFPMVTDRFCFAKAPNGEWKLAILDQGG
jgi:hypothetical protein